MELTRFDKKNDSPRMQRRGVRTGRKTAFVGEIEHDSDCGHGEAVVAEIFDGHSAHHEKENEFLFDDGSSHHSSGHKHLFKDLEDIPHGIILQHLVGSVHVQQWGTVELNREGECGGITLKNCLYIPGMRTNLFNGQKAREAG